MDKYHPFVHLQESRNFSEFAERNQGNLSVTQTRISRLSVNAILNLSKPIKSLKLHYAMIMYLMIERFRIAFTANGKCEIRVYVFLNK